MTNSEPLSRALLEVLREKQGWRLDDQVPAALEQQLLRAGGPALDAVVAVGKTGIEGARLAALLVVKFPDLPWPAEELAVTIASKLSKDKPEDRSARYEALQGLVGRQPGLVALLLRRLVLDVPERQMEVALLPDLCQQQRGCPGIFLDALKRVAAVPGQQMVMSGLIFRGFCDLPPDADAEIQAEIALASERFDDAAWIRGADEVRLIELLGDLPSLAGVVLVRSALELALDCVERCLSLRQWSREVGAALVAPLVMWKDQLADVAPWMEDVYEKYLARMTGTPRAAEAINLLARIHAGYYRQLRHNPVIERKQAWRQWAEERTGHRRQVGFW